MLVGEDGDLDVGNFFNVLMTTTLIKVKVNGNNFLIKEQDTWRKNKIHGGCNPPQDASSILFCFIRN